MDRKMTHRVAAIGILALAAAFLASPAPAETIQRQFPVGQGGKITFDLASGGEIEVTGWGRNEVAVTAILEGRSRSDYEVTVEQISGGVLVRSSRIGPNRSSSTNFSFEVSVPDRFDVEVDSAGGSIKIVGVEGEFTGQTAGGALKLMDVRGRLGLKTMGGNLTLEDAEIDGEISTMGGNVNLSEVAGDLKVTTMGGNVNLQGVSGNVRTSTMGGNITHSGGDGRGRDTRVELHTMGGSITVDTAPEGADLHTMGGSIQVRSAGRFVKAKTMGGTITIEEVDGSVDAETMGGNVSVRVVEGPLGQTRDIDLSSKGGDIDLVVPDGFSMDVEIDLAYTRDSRQAYGIESDFRLEIQESADWDYGRGSPRKHIIGRGRVGGGAHKVRISTVNGDVHLRKGSR